MSTFNADLPALISTSPRDALERTNQAGHGTTSYRAPGAASAVNFILKKTKLGGGSSVETTEYPFGGGWSNRSLNEKPQSIQVEGVLRGEGMLTRRNQLIEALRVPTDDDAPGFVELPFWGRFPVVVPEWEVSDETSAQGEVSLSLTFTRAGLSEVDRRQTIDPTKVASATEKVQAAAGNVFETAMSIDKRSPAVLSSGFSALADKLMLVVGRIQAARADLNALTATVGLIGSLIEQGKLLPRDLALALFGALTSIVNTVVGVAEDPYNSGAIGEGVIGTDRNPKNVLVALAADSAVLSVPTGSSRDLITKAAIETLYRSALFMAVGALLPSLQEVRVGKMREYFALLRKMEESIDRETPAQFAACVALRTAVHQSLVEAQLETELTTTLVTSVPTLALAQALGVTYEQLVALNASWPDQHCIRGVVSYV